MGQDVMDRKNVVARLLAVLVSAVLLLVLLMGCTRWSTVGEPGELPDRIPTHARVVTESGIAWQLQAIHLESDSLVGMGWAVKNSVHRPRRRAFHVDNVAQIREKTRDATDVWGAIFLGAGMGTAMFLSGL